MIRPIRVINELIATHIMNVSGLLFALKLFELERQKQQKPGLMDDTICSPSFNLKIAFIR